MRVKSSPIQPFIKGLIVILLIVMGPLAKAQDAGNSSAAIDTRGALGTILMSGLVGGIIGLSTLSFYDKPEKHIRNITWGAGIGMISAALFITFDVAQNASHPAKTSLYVFPDESMKVANLGLTTRF
jgi:hypothetical protein